MKYPPLRLVYVEWWDSCHIHGGWKRSIDVMEMRPGLIMSVGWVMQDTKRFLTIVAHGCNEQRELQGDLCIPRGCIKSIRTLKIPR